MLMFKMKIKNNFIILVCSVGFYGLMCNIICSFYCIDLLLCDYVIGSCKVDC